MRQHFPILKKHVRAREFNSLLRFVASRCNSLCRTCFCFDKLNSLGDLTMRAEVRAIPGAGLT